LRDSGTEIGHDRAMEPIELAADGLLLRAWRDTDAEAVYQACQDPLIQRFTTVPVPYLREHAQRFVTEQTDAGWAAGTSALLGIFDAGSGELLGSHGLVRLDLPDRSAELGLWIVPAARGRSVAERATRAVAHWAFEVLRLRLLTWWAVVGNQASKLVAQRVGFSFDGASRAALHERDGGLVDGWRGTLLPGEVRDTSPADLAPGAPGSRRARVFGTAPPRLIAGPVTLRQPGERDIDDMVATCQDPEAAHWTTVPVPYERAHAVGFATRRVPDGWLRGTAAVFVIADPDDRYAGTIDLRLDPDDPSTAEIGYLVAPWARGKGYGTDAVRGICRWGFQKLALRRIIWRAHVGNHASRRVAEKAGFVLEGVARQACEQRGERRDAWTATLLPDDLRR
jgi:RimJ/RimL family protein N-acetyltransferase